MNKRSMSGRRRPPTGDNWRWSRFVIGVGVRKRLVILLKSKIYCLALIFLLLEIEILEIVIGYVSSIVKKLVVEKLVKRRMGSIA